MGLLLFLGAIGATAAEDQVSVFSLELEAGAVRNSSLSVVELDQVYREPDNAWLLTARLEGSWQLGAAYTFSGGYSYSSTNYRKYDAFDVVSQQLFADFRYAVGSLQIGASHSLTNTALDSDDLLLSTYSSFYLTRVFGKRWLLRAALNLQGKSFPELSGHNAHNHGMGMNILRFFNAQHSHLAIGAAFENESAKAAEFDYNGLSFNAGLTHHFQLLGKDHQFRLTWHYIDRAYSQPQSELGGERRDLSQTTAAAWEISLNPYLTVVSRLSYADYRSNLVIVDHTEVLASVSLRVRF